jgi:hypothetical protein
MLLAEVAQTLASHVTTGQPPTRRLLAQEFVWVAVNTHDGLFAGFSAVPASYVTWGTGETNWLLFSLAILLHTPTTAYS